MTAWQWGRWTLLLLISVGTTGFLWSPWPFLPLAAASSALLIFNLVQTLRLRNWLINHEYTDAPSLSGLWREVTYLVQRPLRRGQRYKRRFQAITDRIQDSTSALQEAVVMVDRHGNLEWWNHSAERFLGLRSPVDTNQPITNIIRAPEFAEYLATERFTTPLTMPSPIRKSMHLEFKVTPFGRNDRLIIVHDVTRLRQLEQIRKDFVANVSHELRTPLTVIRGYLETFEDLCGNLPDRHLRILAQMQEQAGRMDALVRDLLVLSRLETQHQEAPDPIDVISLLEQITKEAIAMSAGRHTIRLNIDSEEDLQGYPQELRSAFTNIIINAVKYTPDNGHIDIRWYRDNQSLCMSVTDDGVGIESHHLPRLTERFYRAEASRSKATGGTGLGLAIVKHVLLHHQGELNITSELGTGSTFVACFNTQRTLAIKRDNTSSLSASSST